MNLNALCRATYLLAAVSISTFSLADTVALTNGNKINGTVVTDGRENGGPVVLAIGDIGAMTFKASEIANIVKGDNDSSMPTNGKYIEVKIGPGKDYYGDGAYYGIEAPESDNKSLVLAVPGTGKTAIPRHAIASTEEIGEGDVGITSSGIGARPASITTTHVVHLKNGEKMIGDVMETTPDQPLKLRIGDMGVVTLARGDIDRVEEKAGSIELLTAPVPAAADPNEATSNDATDMEALKRQLKEKILRDLLDALLDSRIDRAIGGGTTRLMAPTLIKATNEEVAMIQFLMAELGRQRTRHRVRAERKLIAIGSPALVFLEPLTRHPFELTRRGTQRVVRDINDPAGAPLSIEALTDEDHYVRKLAYESLRKLLPEVEIAYDVDGSVESHIAVRDEYRQAWDHIRLNTATEHALNELVSNN